MALSYGDVGIILSNISRYLSEAHLIPLQVVNLHRCQAAAGMGEEQVEPEVTKRAYTLTTDQLADAMGLVAGSNNWQIESTGDSSGLKVRPY